MADREESRSRDPENSARLPANCLAHARLALDKTADFSRFYDEHIRNDGTRGWVRTDCHSIHGPSGKVEYILAVVRPAAESEIATRRRLLDAVSGDDANSARGGSGQSGWRSDESRAPGPSPLDDPEDTMVLSEVLYRAERNAIIRGLKAANGRRNETAEMLKISRSCLYRRIAALGIEFEGS